MTWKKLPRCFYLLFFCFFHRRKDPISAEKRPLVEIYRGAEAEEPQKKLHFWARKKSYRFITAQRFLRARWHTHTHTHARARVVEPGGQKSPANKEDKDKKSLLLPPDGSDGFDSFRCFVFLYFPGARSKNLLLRRVSAGQMCRPGGAAASAQCKRVLSSSPSAKLCHLSFVGTWSS